jgi:hypothetical protein
MQIIAFVIATTVALGASEPGRHAADAAQESAAAPGTADRQANDDIRRLLTVGQRVTIADDRGLQLEGRIGALEPDRLTLISRRLRTEVAYDRIVRIDRPHDGLGNGALWGLGVGAALGFALVLDEEFSECDSSGFLSCGDPHPAAYALVPAIIGGLGAAIGVGVDALIRREPNIYRRGRSTAAVTVRPSRQAHCGGSRVGSVVTHLTRTPTGVDAEMTVSTPAARLERPIGCLS